MHFIRRAGSIAVMGLALTRAGSALADEAPSVEEIKAAEIDFNRGREAYKQGLYTEAAEYFESADAHAPNDRVLELAIGARDKAGALDRAATLAQFGVDRSPNNERMKKVAAPLLEKAKAEFMAVVVNCNEACNILDGSRIVPGKATLKRTVWLMPGDHTIRAVWSDDRGLSKPASGKAGETTSVDFKAPPVVKKAPQTITVIETREKKEEKWRGFPPIVFFIGAGATAVAGGLTIWSGIDTVKSPGKDAVTANCLNADCELLKNGDKKELRTNLFLAGTGVLGVATAVVGILLTDWKGAPKENPKADHARLRVEPFVGYSNGPQLGALGRF